MRKELKQHAKKSLRKHYWIFVILCLAGAFMGSKYSQFLVSVTSFYQPFSKIEALDNSVKSKFSINITDVMNKVLSEKDQARLDQFVSGVTDKAESEKQKTFGRSRGILAAVVNGVTSNSFLISVAMAISTLIGSTDAVMRIFILLSGLLMVAVWVFGINIFPVISARMFLEGRYNKELPLQRVLFIWMVKRWRRTAGTMFVMRIFEFLWSLTIVGGIVKHYSYFLVPFIVADNPDIKPLEAITLSRKMMDGHKREAFLLELSFAGWYLLGVITLGVLDVLYTSPYKSCAVCEYYILQRRQSVEQHLPQMQWLNGGYQLEEALEVRRKWLAEIHYIRRYSFPSLIMMFFTFSLIGWIWEVALTFITLGSFANRGFLHGPWLPIYGAGGILILQILKRFRKNPPLEFLSAMILCGIVEYFTSYALEKLYDGKKWWDYSGYFLNINGRICAEGLLVFGFGAMLIVYVAAPLLDNLIQKISQKVLIMLCVLLISGFSADAAYSFAHPNVGKGITDLK